MPDTRCSRCGRMRRPDEVDEGGQLAVGLGADDPDTRSIFGGQGPWATIDGVVVCPTCQTPAEQRDIASRIVSAIESEIERAHTTAADAPLPEPALIAYAMQLRERLESLAGPAGEPSGEPDRGAEQTTRAGIALRVAITAAFLTGHPVGVRIDEYDRLQSDLGRELGRLTGQGWSVNADHWRQEGTYHSGGGFSSMLPLVLARRDGLDALARATAVLAARPEAEHMWLARLTPGWTLRPVSLRIDVYDLGMAVMNGTFSVHAPASLDLSAVARTLKQLVWLKADPDAGVLSPIATTFRELANETTRQFAAAVGAAAPGSLQEPWLAPFLDALPERTPGQRTHPADWGRLLWMHPVHLLEVDDPEQRAPSAAQLAPPFHQPVAIPEGRFVPGIGWSAIVTDTDSSATDVPLRLLELHWAYIALYMEIDRGLLALLDDDRWQQSHSLTTLEAEADRVFADSMRVMKAQARLDSALASLGGDEQAIWDVIADVTKFSALFDGVDRKVDALQRVAERRVQQAAAVQARRTSAILSFLTALTVVTVTVALIGNFLGSRSDTLGHVELRMLIVALALLASIGLYREAFRERPRRRRDTH
jgi:hypothetical protein